MSSRKLWGQGAVVVTVLFAVYAWVAGCSSSSNNNGPTGVTTNGQGLCASACSKPCAVDSDCETSSGELCCDYGSAGKVCQSAMSCPQFCAADTMCDPAMGQACVVTSLAPGAQRSCQKAQNGLQLCSVDTDCTNSGDVCCKIYNQGICLASNQCPKACGTSSDCQTSLGEVCCTSVKNVDPSLTAAGLCLNPMYAPCPKACTASSDCAATGELCCNGICQLSCPKACKSDNDCSGQNRICCGTTQVTAAQVPPHVFKTGPTCSGTPTFASCADCMNSGCTGCAGCSTPGTCNGTPSSTDCSTCGNSFGCASCQGCTQGDAGAGACIGTPNYPTCADFGSFGSCATAKGCTLVGASCTGTPSYADCTQCPAGVCGGTNCQGCVPTTGQGTCSGTPDTCATWTSLVTNYQAPCQAEGCTWTAADAGVGGVCSGLPTSCTAFTSAATCTSGCLWTPGPTTCSGTLTPCGQLSGTNCSNQGCFLNSGTCTGTVTPCGQLDSSTCTTPGCNFSTTATACSGTLTPCGQLSAQSTCQSQRGCSWLSSSNTCLGTITPCNQLATQVACRTQSGCTWQ